jgi:hypothetical protein
MDETTKNEILKNISGIMSATTSGDIKKIEQQTILIIKSSTKKD